MLDETSGFVKHFIEELRDQAGYKKASKHHMQQSSGQSQPRRPQAPGPNPPNNDRKDQSQASFRDDFQD